MFLRLTAQDDELAKLWRYERKLLERKPAGLVSAALANKTARIARTA